jgi:hypothetical protein
MRRVYALLGLTRKYGDERVAQACETALVCDMFDVRRLERMILLASPPPGPSAPGRIIPMPRFLRPISQYALPLNPNPKGDAPNHDH